MSSEPWYRESFGADYLDLYAHRDAEEAERHAAFAAGVWPALAAGARVLDLACGAGRHAAPLARRGFAAVGVDLSLPLLARARQAAESSAASGRLAAGDMRCMPFSAGVFEGVLNFFTSFGYFDSERENFLVLEEVARVLAPGGRFLIDLLNADAALRVLEPSERRRLPDGREVAIERSYDAERHRFDKRVVLAGPEPRVFRESVRAYRPDEVAMGLAWAGLELVGMAGDFDASPYDRARSARMILMARKPL